MKTLFVLLLLAGALGAAYWNTQRPGEGLDALKADAQSAMQRLVAGVQAVRDSSSQDDQAQSAIALADTRDELLAARSAMDDNALALTGRIDALENELTRTMTSAEAGVVQGRLDTLDERLTGLLEATPDDADRRAADDKLVGRLDAIEGRLQLFDRRLEEQDPASRLDQVTERLDAIVERANHTRDSLDRQIAAAEVDRADLAERSDTMTARLTSLAGRALAGTGESDGTADEADGADRSGLAAALDARLVALEQSLAGGRADGVRIAAIDARLEDITTRIDDMSEMDRVSSDSISALRAEIDAVATDSKALSIDSIQQQISDQLASLDADVRAGADSEDEVGALTVALDTTRERIRQLESQVANLPASSSAADSAQENQSALETQIAALERRLETLPREADPELVSSIDQVREQVDELSARGFVTQEELRAQAEGKNVEYKIYFDKNSTQITDEATRVLDSFIAQETNRTSGVAIYGFTDRRGPASYNQQLAQRRAANVRSYLIQNGFDYTKIGNVAGLGEDAAAALLEDEQEDAQQRVVVLFAAQL